MADLTKLMQKLVQQLRKIPTKGGPPGIILRYEGPGTSIAHHVGGKEYPIPYDFSGYPEMERAKKMLQVGIPESRISLYHKGAEQASQKPEDFANFPLPRRKP